MKIVYCGSSDFSCEILEGLVKNHFSPVMIITTPDKPGGRGLKMHPSPVKLYAQRHSLSCLSPSSLRQKEFLKDLKNLSFDILLVVSYGKIITQELLALPKLMSLGLHPSLLPQYRGPAPIQWALLKGELQTGVTVFQITKEIDSGPIILQKSLPIGEDDDFVSLSQKLISLGGDTLYETFSLLTSKTHTLIPQDNTLVSYAPKLKKQDGLIRWNQTAPQIKNVIRATQGWPSAYTFYKKKLIKILDVSVVPQITQSRPSEIVHIDKGGIDVATKQFVLKIKRLKPQGSKEMSAWSFTCGYRVLVGDRFSNHPHNK